MSYYIVASDVVEVISTDCAVNPANSAHPLYNLLRITALAIPWETRNSLAHTPGLLSSFFFRFTR